MQPRSEIHVDAPAARPARGARSGGRFVRWDPLVRLTHWLIAAAILVNALLSEEGSSLHVWVGYAAGALLALRLVWGLVGPRPARFSAFPPTLARAWRHVGEIVRGGRSDHVSHNPLGALMVYALWATLAVVVGSGLAMDQGRGFAEGPAFGANVAEAPRHEAEDEAEGHGGGEEAGEEEVWEEEVWEEVHEAAANILFVLAALHVVGVAFETRRRGPGLVRAMITGGGARRRD